MGNLSELVASESPVAYRISFALIRGEEGGPLGAIGGLFLAQAYYWSGRPNVEQMSRDGWFWWTQEQITEQTGLTRTETETARRRLRDLGALSEERRGQPARMWFRLDKDRLYTLLLAVAEARDLDCGKRANKDAENLQTSMRKSRNQDRGKPANLIVGNLHTISETPAKTYDTKTSPETSPPDGGRINGTGAVSLAGRQGEGAVDDVFDADDDISDAVIVSEMPDDTAPAAIATSQQNAPVRHVEPPLTPSDASTALVVSSPPPSLDDIDAAYLGVQAEAVAAEAARLAQRGTLATPPGVRPVPPVNYLKPAPFEVPPEDVFVPDPTPQESAWLRGKLTEILGTPLEVTVICRMAQDRFRHRGDYKGCAWQYLAYHLAALPLHRPTSAAGALRKSIADNWVAKPKPFEEMTIEERTAEKLAWFQERKQATG
jgi:hypothetical protein